MIHDLHQDLYYERNWVKQNCENQQCLFSLPVPPSIIYLIDEIDGTVGLEERGKDGAEVPSFSFPTPIRTRDFPFYSCLYPPVSVGRCIRGRLLILVLLVTVTVRFSFTQIDHVTLVKDISYIFVIILTDFSVRRKIIVVHDR